MSIDDCFYLGYVVKTKGRKGDFQVKLDVSFPEEYHNLESVFVEINKQLIPFFLKSIRIGENGKATVRFDNEMDSSDMDQLPGSHLYLPLDSLPTLSGNHFYFHEVEGFELIDKAFGLVGKIVRVQESTAQDLFVVSHEKGEVLIPILDETVLSIDREKKIIEVQSAEGLIEMYLEL